MLESLSRSSPLYLCRSSSAPPARGTIPHVDQIVRAARSTTANLAEGYGRFHYLDNAKFCSNARGSCWEVLDHLITAADEKFISKELLGRGRELVGHAVRLINGYMKYLKQSRNPNPISDNK